MNCRHIVLDLDECLVKTFSGAWDIYENIISNPKLFYLRHRVFMIKLEGINMWGVKRPYLDRFIRYIYNNFESVSVWSAGSKDYVYAIVEIIFRDYKYPDIVMTWNNVVVDDNKRYWKALDKFYNKNFKANPSNTFLLDNKLDNFRDDPNNGVHIPDYDPLPTEEEIARDDTCLLVVILFIASIINKSTDIREVDKNLSY